MRLSTDCTILPLSRIDLSNVLFDCGNADINDFLFNDSHNYSNQLLSKTYCYVSDKTLKNGKHEIVCFFTVANDSLKTYTLPNNPTRRIRKDIPHKKQLKSYPATLIGRMGVNLKFKSTIKGKPSLGDQMLDFVKEWFVEENNKTGCRFLVVDALNSEKVLNFYERNGFKFVFPNDAQEKEHYKKEESNLHTRLMMFDLMNKIKK